MNEGADDMTQALLEALSEVERVAPGLRFNQLMMLLHVIRSEGVRMSDLAALCEDSNANVSRGVRAMSSPGDPGALQPAFGLVELLRGAADGRARHIAPTARGLALAQRLALILGEAAAARRTVFARQDRPDIQTV